ncbi:2-phospho-L-lactate guanylyltransferase [Tsukamurella serpentis]
MTAPRGAYASSVVVVTAVKPLEAAKSRFAAGSARLREKLIPALVLAMFRDTLTAALAARSVAAVFVVSSDPQVLAAAAAHGAQAVPEVAPRGLNAALEDGARIAAQTVPDHSGVLALQADLPALTADELDAFLDATVLRRGYVPDRADVGTAALFTPAGTALDPQFGPGSAAAHRAGGALAHPGPWPGLRTDVDTPADLAAAPPLGAHTRAVLTATDSGYPSNSYAGCARMKR